MPTRRHTLATGLAASLGLTLGIPAAAAPHANPMPAALRRALEQEENPPVLGNANGDITLTQFFDYNCPFCRKMMPRIPELIGAEPNLRIVFREWPVFGDGSMFAAQAALAARNQNQYWQMHKALMQMKDRAVEASVIRVATDLGLDMDKLRADMESRPVMETIYHSMDLADHMGLAGTPTWIAGHEALFGEVTMDELRALIAKGRADLAS